MLFNAIKQHYNRLKTVKEKKARKTNFSRRTHIKVKNEDRYCTWDIRHSRDKTKTAYPQKNILIEKIKNFFVCNDVSGATAGKQETVTHRKTKMQKRYLLDTMKNLYRLFKKEIPDERCSYSYFIEQSFYVKPPILGGRVTCVCKTHTNVQYLINALHKNKFIPHPNMNNLIAGAICSIDRPACRTANCEDCRTK